MAMMARHQLIGLLLSIVPCQANIRGIHRLRIPFPQYAEGPTQGTTDEQELQAQIVAWNERNVFGGTAHSESPSAEENKNPLLVFKQYWMDKNNSDPNHEDNSTDSLERLLSRKVAYQASYFKMPTDVAVANRAGIDMFARRGIDLAHKCVWGKATAGAGSLGTKLGAVDFRGMPLSMKSSHTADHEDVEGLWTELFGGSKEAALWQQFEKAIYETVKKRMDVKLFLAGKSADVADSPSFQLLLEHRFWAYDSTRGGTGTWHRDLFPFDTHFANDEAWFDEVANKSQLNEASCYRGLFKADSANVFDPADPKVLMFTLVNNVLLTNVDSATSGSRLRDRETDRANQFRAVEGTGNMFRTGGDSMSGSGFTTKHVDYDVPFHAGPPGLGTFGKRGTRYFFQTKVLVLPNSC